MSAFTPPDSMSPDDIKTVADVRRAVWINGMFGLVAGTFTGSFGHYIIHKLQTKYVLPDNLTAAQAAAQGKVNTNSLIYKCLKPLPPLCKNTFMLSLFGGGALGSLVLSTTAGKNAVHLLHPIFGLGRDEHAGKSPYQIAAMSKSEEKEREQMMNDKLDAKNHRTRSIQRKDSLKRRLEIGHSLSDTHNNTWPESDTEELQKDKAFHRAKTWETRQSNRRNTLRDRIEHGKALSNSTGGNWDER